MVRPMTPTAPPAALGAERRLADAVEELGRLPVLSATVRRVQAIAESEDAGIGAETSRRASSISRPIPVDRTRGVATDVANIRPW